MITLLGGKCVDCGSIHNLEFDHIDRTLKSFNIGACYSLPLVELLEELKKCQLLCHKCHKLKTREIDGLKAEHGKYSMYRHYKCRCALCKEANRRQHAEWRYKKLGIGEAV